MSLWWLFIIFYLIVLACFIMKLTSLLSARVLFSCILNIQFRWVTHNFYGERKKLNFLIYGYGSDFWISVFFFGLKNFILKGCGKIVCNISFFFFYFNTLAIWTNTFRLLSSNLCYDFWKYRYLPWLFLLSSYISLIIHLLWLPTCVE